MDVLDAQRHAGQRPGIAAGLDLTVKLARRRAGMVGGQGADGVEARVDAGDLVEMGLDDGPGGHFPTADAAGDLSGGQAGKLLV
jgi:hypothetical protein